MPSASPAPPYRLVMFDFDGTLADSFPVFRRVCERVSDRYGVRRICDSEVEQLRAMDTTAILDALGISRWRLPAILRYARTQMAAERTRIALFAGIGQLLAALEAARVHVAVVSSNGEHTVRAVLGTALSAHVQTFACGVGLFGKAAIIRRILRDTQVAAADAALVGDEPRDIAAAHGAGVTAIAVTWGYAAAAALEGAHVRCDTVPALTQLLGVTA